MLRDLIRRWVADEGTVHEVADEAHCLRIFAHSRLEHMRAGSVFSKEPGTVQWIRRCVKPGQVFLDIGANIGIYTLMAAARVGATGQVYSFEPHCLNAASLLKNVSLNDFARNVRVSSLPLSSRTGFTDFHYHSLEAGSAFSQAGLTVDHEGRAFQPAATERKAIFSLDDLLMKGELSAPHHIKIDVDGLETDILHGMTQLLKTTPPLTLQVEVSGMQPQAVIQLLGSAGYSHYVRHDTYGGSLQLQAGAAPDSVPHNLLFSREPLPFQIRSA